MSPSTLCDNYQTIFSYLVCHLIEKMKHCCIKPSAHCTSICEYLKDVFNYEYIILQFGYPSHFAETNNCGVGKKSTIPTNYIYPVDILQQQVSIKCNSTNVLIYADALIYIAK